MVNEATPFYGQLSPLALTCSNTLGIERGALLTLTDPMTAAKVTASAAAVAGIADKEKIALNGETKLSVYRTGVWRVTCSGDVTVGEAVQFEVENTVCAMGPLQEHFAGYALETAGDGETFLIELKPGHTHQAAD